ncbi:MAG: methylmalonyl Co-A mutase-associated GTPase MeaB [Alphaproteobacteria bacterium]
MTAAQDGFSIQELVKGVLARDRRVLARAITLVESTRKEDLARAEAMLTELLPYSGRAERIGISGAPGVGKSTIIEAFGAYVTALSKNTAVLAVDPTSPRSGGSIMGDKTRMTELARNPRAFIRPSPSGAGVGGVARRTREAMIVVEAAGFDVVIVETVGVGQSETAVADMTDLFVLLIGPGGGDYLQGIKRGVMELADIVLVTKADRDLTPAAARAAADYQAALNLMRPKFADLPPSVLQVSSLEGRGIADAWGVMERTLSALRRDGRLATIRAEQAKHWLWSEIHAALLEAVESDPKTAKFAREIEAKVVGGKELPPAAARRFVRALGCA